MRLANEMYQIYIENFPRSPHINKAKARLVYTRLGTYRGPAFNDTGLIDSRRELVELQFTNPRLASIINSDGLITRIDESLGQKMFHVAKYYLETNNPIAAEYTVRRLLQTHENSTASIEALELLVPKILPQLPPIVLDDIGDFYEVYQEVILGRVLSSTTTLENHQ